MNSKIVILNAVLLALFLGACGDVQENPAADTEHDHDEHNESEEASVEGRTHIERAVRDALGISTEVAGPVTMEEWITVYGHVKTNTDRVTHISARFDGV